MVYHSKVIWTSWYHFEWNFEVFLEYNFFTSLNPAKSQFLHGRYYVRVLFQKKITWAHPIFFFFYVLKGFFFRILGHLRSFSFFGENCAHPGPSWNDSPDELLLFSYFGCFSAISDAESEKARHQNLIRAIASAKSARA